MTERMILSPRKLTPHHLLSVELGKERTRVRARNLAERQEATDRSGNHSSLGQTPARLIHPCTSSGLIE